MITMKRKGFTLIELLGVIVVLAVIALITIPVILGVIEKARKEAFRDSVYGIMASTDIYIAGNYDVTNDEFVCDGTTCSNKKSGLKFKGKVPISGSVLVEDNTVSAKFISDGVYCAYGTRENLTIADNCIELDNNAPIVDESKIRYVATTNSIQIIFNDFAIDKELGIKEYQLTLSEVNGQYEDKKIVPSDNEDVLFQKLKQNTEYNVKIVVFDYNDNKSEVNLVITTLNFDSPDIALENTSESISGYYLGQVAKINYNDVNINTPEYFVKTTRLGVSNLSVTESCGTGVVPGNCNSISSTTSLNSGVWYKVSNKNIEITYSNLSNTTGTVYAITYDGQNYSNASTATLSKITKLVDYQVIHSQMNVSGSEYNLTEKENLKGYAYLTVTPATKTYTGFTSPSKQTVTVSDTGSTVVNYTYNRNQYTVSVNKGTGIEHVSGAGKYYYGATVKLDYSPTAGYHFTSWAGNYNTGTFTMPAGNVTMTANGTGNTYYIAYNGNGATSGSMGTTTCTYGQNCTLAGLGYGRTGHSFNRWSGSNGGSYSNGQTVRNLTTTNGGTVTMSVVWQVNQYTVTVNKGTGIASVSGGGTYSYGSTVSLGYSLTTGYHFTSWTGNYNTGSFTMPAGNVTMTANGAANTYTVKYNGNGGTGTMSDTTCTYDKDCTLRANSFSKSGYKFNGWTSSWNGNFANKATVKNLTEYDRDVIVLQAKWKSNSTTYTAHTKATDRTKVTTSGYTKISVKFNNTCSAYDDPTIWVYNSSGKKICAGSEIKNCNLNGTAYVNIHAAHYHKNGGSICSHVDNGSTGHNHKFTVTLS